jgi:hypothetical protein
MLRQFATALVILGMLIQPLSAAVPDLAQFDQSSSSVLSDSSDMSGTKADHGSMGLEKASDTPCHEAPPEQTASELCTDCDSDCDASTCASACSVSAAAVFSRASQKASRKSVASTVFAMGSVPQGPPSSIFHPPKHA